MYRRNVLAAVLGSLFLCALCHGQNPAPVSFSTVQSANSTYSDVISVDVNNDGLPDMVEVSVTQPYTFTVYLNNGNGSFTPLKSVSVPSLQAGVSYPVLAGDFNHDGKADLIFITGSDQISIYFGNGDGTFQAPKTESLGLPSGSYLNEMVAADFNHDGNPDLVAEMNSNQDDTGQVYVLKGDGKGDFTNEGLVFTAPDSDYIQSLVTGDFDADNNADIALTTGAMCGETYCSSTVYVLYGDGDFGFSETTPYSTSGGFSIGAGDVNGNGHTDLFGEDLGSDQLVVLYGQSSRTFTPKTYALPSGSFIQSVVMADFNGDGRMDIAGLNTGYLASTGSANNLTFALANASGGFTIQNVKLSSSDSYGNLMLGNYDRTTRPDLALEVSSNGDNGAILAYMNQTTSGYYGGCAYPHTGAGIQLCYPSGASSGNPVTFKASANSFGQIRKFELWVDGQKVSEQHNNWGGRGWFDLVSNLAAGTHKCTLNVTTIGNDAMDYNFNLTVK